MKRADPGLMPDQNDIIQEHKIFINISVMQEILDKIPILAIMVTIGIIAIIARMGLRK